MAVSLQCQKPGGPVSGSNVSLCLWHASEISVIHGGRWIPLSPKTSMLWTGTRNGRK
eukprot:symbB.v1.2.034147.t1/scaffold4360.1/size40697/1